MAKLNPYLSFKSEARQALEFYQSVLGGELTISPYSSVPEVAGMLGDPSEGDLVMLSGMFTGITARLLVPR